VATALGRNIPDDTQGHAPPIIEQYARTESSAPSAARPARIRDTFSDVHAHLIKESFARVMADPPRVMEYFYARLFAANPEIRAIFPHAMTRTRAAAFDALTRLVASLDSPRECEQFVGQLARDHRKYGVRDAHYQPFFAALLATAEHFSGSAWTADMVPAWHAASDYLTEIMRTAAGTDAAVRPAWWVGEIVQHDQRGATIAVLTIRPDRPMSYVPGQYVAVQVPSRPRLWRNYSIANAHRDNGLLDIHVRAVPGGTVSMALVGFCDTGDTLILGPPRGDMAVRPDSERDLVCVAGGTGLAPIKAMIESVVCGTGHGRRRAITLYFGVRRREDLYDMRDLETLRLGYPSLTLIPVVDAEPDSGGRVGQDGGPGSLRDAVSAHPSYRSTDVYISGPVGMVRETLRTLASRVPANCLHHDPLDALRAASSFAHSGDLEELRCSPKNA
jgi:NAD(P)H-flavin reductase/hemoglobin-like flavoprotein